MVGIDLERLAKQTMSATEAEAVCIEIEGLRADLKAVAVALENMLPWTRGVMDAEEPGVSNYAVIVLEADKALDLPGVRAVLEGAKDGS